MRKLILFVIFALFLVACQQKPIQSPAYLPGEMVSTRFGAKVLILDTTTTGDEGRFRGSYRVKRGDKSQEEEMTQAEILSKID